MYDLGWLRWAGIEVQGKIIDTMIAAPLLNENRRYYNLNSLSGEYLGEWKNEKMLKSAADMYGVDPKGSMWKLDSTFVGRYAEQDAAVTLRLWDRLRGDLVNDECTGIFDLESSLLPVLLDMKTRGVRVDTDKAEQVQKELKRREDALLLEIKDLTQVSVEPWVATSIAKAFDAVGLTYERTKNTDAPSFTKQFLANHEHPLAQKIVRLREFNKANTTFIETILEHSHNGRIHCDFNPLRSDEGAQSQDDFLRPTRTSANPGKRPRNQSDDSRLVYPEEGASGGRLTTPHRNHAGLPTIVLH